MTFTSIALHSLVAGSLWLLTRWIVQRIFNPLRVVPGPKSSSFVLGNVNDIFGLNGLSYQDKLVDDYGLVARTAGMLSASELFISDPGALHQILSVDVEKWHRAAWFREGSDVFFGPSLLSAEGAQHKRQRRILNPLFAQSNIRGLTPLFYNITYQLVEKISVEVRKGGSDGRNLNVMEWMTKVALELIGQGGIGYTFDAFETDSNEYNIAARELFPTARVIFPALLVLPLLRKLGNAAFQRRAVETVAPLLGTFGKNVLALKGHVDVMDSVTLQVFSERKNAIKRDETDGIGQGKDIISLLLKAAASQQGSEYLPEEEIRAQMSTLIFAGHETTSGAVSRVLHILSLCPDVQTRLREEISQARAVKGDLSFEDITALPYLHDVVREVLRLSPPSSLQDRVAAEDTVVPLQFPIKSNDGKTELTQLSIPKGTLVHVGIYAMNRAESIWGPDAREFKPERWRNLPATVTDANLPGVFGSNMTFLAGPHACIGFRFAVLEIKIVLSLLLSTFSFSPAPGVGEITWCMGPTNWPSVKDTALMGAPNLPLRVTLL